MRKEKGLDKKSRYIKLKKLENDPQRVLYHKEHKDRREIYITLIFCLWSAVAMPPLFMAQNDLLLLLKTRLKAKSKRRKTKRNSAPTGIAHYKYPL